MTRACRAVERSGVCMDRRAAAPTCNIQPIHRSSMCQQERCCLNLPHACCHVETCLPFVIRRVDIRPPEHEKAKCGEVLI
eukprot:CAMPEP_0177764350 /NCGR_PEP_ID=MMETSP0491_2-20121128/7356_1 /TAXON_ID=63592 /ORGANISM="Tetraselmis chuii, Strain PLY429" /LENGTH=79 /DNA_ID=CAMNT_0019280515 /DNA_START=64 /DNA_END=303 /DNA_ORIENTATION=+